MTVLIINPNSTASMTEAMVAGARQAVPTVNIEGWTSSKGPASIQGAEDGDAATPPLLGLVKKAAGLDVSAIIIGCFDDTALRRAAALAPCPVIGLGQAAFHYAALRSWRFSVVTTLAVSVPVIEENIAQYGLAGHLGRVRASDVPVLALEADPETSGRAVTQQALAAEREDGVDALVLGCAGMVQVAQSVGAAVDIPVIDPVVCAVRCAAWLAA